MATTTTGKAIRQALAEQWGDWVFLGAATAASNVAYIVDTERLQGANLPAGMFDNAIVRLSNGETSNVDYVDVVNGRLYLTPNITALAQDDEYEVWLQGIDPDVVDRLRDDALSRFTSVWRPLPVCIIPDGDLETAGVTAWTAGGAATRTKALSSFPDVPSRWLLSVVHTTAATDYLRSTIIDVQPGERFFLEVPVSAYVTATPANPATATAVPWNETTDAAITVGGIRTAHTGKGWGKISLLFTVPAGCYRLSIRLFSDTASSTTQWGAFAIHRRGKSEVPLPERITTKKRVATSFGTTDVNNAASEVLASQFTIRETRNVERFQVGNHVILKLNPPTSDNSIYFYERGFFARLSAGYFTVAQRLVGDAATTDCPKEYVVSALAERVAKFYMDKYGSQFQDDWVRASSEYAYWEGEFGAEPKFVEDNEQPVSVPQIRV